MEHDKTKNWELHSEKQHDVRERRKKHHGHGHHVSPLEHYEQMTEEERILGLLRKLGFVARVGAGGNAGQERILRLLMRRGSMTQRELTEMLDIKPGSASEILGKLERAGMITRSESRADRRTADVSLTDEGVKRAGALSEQLQEGLLGDLSVEEKTKLLALLEKLNNGWEKRRKRDVEVH